MKIKLGNTLASLLSISLFMLMSVNASAVNYDIQEHMNDGHQNDAGMIDFNDGSLGGSDRDSRFYVGGGLGLSGLDIDNSNDPLVQVTDDSDLAKELFLGYSFNDNFKLEGYYADMGTSVIETYATNPNVVSNYGGYTSGELDYTSYGLSGILAYPVFDALDVFLKVGYSKLDADGSDLGRSVKQENSSGLHLGAGVEYALNDNLGIRLGYNSIDKDDANYWAGNVVYYFGGAEPAPEYVEPMAPVPTPAQQLADLAKNVYFITNETTLTTSAKRALDEAARVMQAHQYLNITVGAHTDSRASDSYNQNLSDGRARSVVNYLIGAGVSASRMASRGFGESRPVASNDTAEGRAQNRRVEIRTVK